MTNAFDKFDQALAGKKHKIDIPNVRSFKEFLLRFGRVKVGSNYLPFSFAGRRALEWVVDRIDEILGSGTGKAITDAVLDVCGGAQFGKTILALHLKAYITGVLFRNFAYYLPDDDLVQGIVDTKDRPDVIGQIPWYAEMVTVGRTLTDSGRAVNRKGAFMITDGERVAQAYCRGMGKIPTTFSADVLLEDEKDDIPPARAKFLTGRMTSSDLRFHMTIGTQRYHGAGQNKQFEDGSQHVGMIKCECGRSSNPEEDFPGVCRVAMDGEPKRTDPRLTFTGDFRQPGADVAEAAFGHDARYYLACPACGRELDREAIDFVARRPDRVALRKWSIRVSQLSCSAIELKQIVADWCQNAVRDPDCMKAFSCDRLAIPKSTAQALDPEILERARSLGEFSLSLTPTPDLACYGGLDTGDRCFFTAREIHGETEKRLKWAEQLSPERARERIPLLFNTLQLSCLFIDIGAERNLARDLCFLVNGESAIDISGIDKPESAYIVFGNGMTWDGPGQRWIGIKCATVEFSLKSGQGIRHKLGITQEKKCYPVIQANRDETIQKVINELLTAEEGVIEVIDSKLRTTPVFRLPVKAAGAPAVLESYDQHLLAGSKKELGNDGKELHFIDKVENHYLLATAYARLAETVIAGTPHFAPGEFKQCRASRVTRAIQERRARTLAG